MADHISKNLSCSEFRGIAISSVVAKVFEASILDRFGSYFVTDDNQFGFKSHTGCTDAIYCVNKIVEAYNKGGDTAHIAVLDVSKAFDRVNHFALFIKLMDRNIPLF